MNQARARNRTESTGHTPAPRHSPAATARKERPSPARQISDRLLFSIGAQKYDKWFGHARLQVEGSSVHIATDSPFVANWIDAHFSNELRGIARETLGNDAEVDIRVDPECVAEAGRITTAPAPVNGSSDAASGPLPFTATRPDRRRQNRRSNAQRQGELRHFDTFIVGECNQMAYAAARRVAEDDDAALDSPLFIHGPCGVGKTHLLQSICTRFCEVHGRSSKARYVTAEQFTNEYIAAVRSNDLESFRKRIRQLDLLVIDDIHFLADKLRTQSEVLHTLDAIDLSGARIVLASDGHPRQIRSFKQALVSRFISGMVVEINRPERETRAKIIRKLARKRNLRLNDGAVEVITRHCVGSVREMEGAITKLSALNEIAGKNNNGEVGVGLCEQLFADHHWPSNGPIRMSSVIETVCGRLQVSHSDLIGSGRHRRVVLARALIAHLGRKLTTHSYPEIAQSIGRAYHSTVHTADQRLRRQLNNDEKVTLNDGQPPLSLRELTDQLRCEILRQGNSR